MHTSRTGIGVITSTAALTGLCLVSGPVAAAPAASQRGDSSTVTSFGFDATAYGSKAEGTSGTSSDATAMSHLPCTRFVPRDRSNHVANADQGGVETQNADTHNFTRQHGRITSATSLATVQGGSLAGGAVRFTDLKARNISFNRSGDGFHVEQFSSVGSLTVGGVPVPIPDDGRTMTVPVPGQGTLVVNDKSRKVGNRGATGTVNALRFIGDDGRVQRTAHAQSRIDGMIEGGLFHGGAWGSQATVADSATSRKGAHQSIPCAGTYGKVLERTTAESEETFGLVGARRSSAYGVQRTNGSAAGYTRSVVDIARFGVLELRNVRGRANVTRQSDGDVVRNPKGTGVGTILIAGQEQSKPPAGEPQDFPGGEFTIRVVDKHRDGIDATGAVVRLFNGTPDNRADDTVVDLGVARLEISRG